MATNAKKTTTKPTMLSMVDIVMRAPDAATILAALEARRKIDALLAERAAAYERIAALERQVDEVIGEPGVFLFPPPAVAVAPYGDFFPTPPKASAAPAATTPAATSSPRPATTTTAATTPAATTTTAATAAPRQQTTAPATATRTTPPATTAGTAATVRTPSAPAAPAPAGETTADAQMIPPDETDLGAAPAAVKPTPPHASRSLRSDK